MDKYCQNDKNSYILGISLTIEALKKIPEYMECVYVSSKALHNSQYDKLLLLTKQYNIPIIEDDYVINKLSIKENCYGIGVFRKYQHSLKTKKHILLYKFNDYGELGTIMRSAVSFNFTDLALIDCDIDYFDPRTVRASMGSIFHLNIQEYASFEQYKKDYKYHLYPFITKENHELKTLKLEKPYSIVIPQDYNGLDNIFDDGYYIKHQGFNQLSLSSLSAIVFNYVYQNDHDNDNVGIILE